MRIGIPYGLDCFQTWRVAANVGIKVAHRGDPLNLGLGEKVVINCESFHFLSPIQYPEFKIPVYESIILVTIYKGVKFSLSNGLTQFKNKLLRKRK